MVVFEDGSLFIRREELKCFCRLFVLDIKIFVAGAKFTMFLNSSICFFGGRVSVTGHSFRVSTIHWMICIGNVDIVRVIYLC